MVGRMGVFTGAAYSCNLKNELSPLNNMYHFLLTVLEQIFQSFDENSFLELI